MNYDEVNRGEVSFNQAGYSQMRLHELFLRIDRLSINPLLFDEDFRCNNYEVIFRDLCSVFSTISSKLTNSEIEEIIEMRNEISISIRHEPVFNSCQSVDRYGGKKKEIKFNVINWDKINDKLFFFRLKLEKQMDKHGFGNPSKKSPSSAVIN